MSGIIEHTIRIYMTSKDLREIAYKMEVVEQNARLGQSLVVKEWSIKDGTILFVIDQDRARKQGLMK